MGKEKEDKLSCSQVEKRTQAYAVNLSVDELKSFFDMLALKAIDGKKTKLSKHLKEVVLKVKHSGTPSNLVNIITLKTKDIISARAASGNMIKEEDRKLLKEYLAAWKEYYLNYTSLLQDKLGQGGGNETTDDKWGLFAQENQGFAQLLLQTQKKDYEKAEKISAETEKTSKLIAKFCKDLLCKLKENWKRPVEITLETWEGKPVLVATKNVMVLSDIIADIESRITSIRNLYAVHFVAKDVFYIDCNLENSEWNGLHVLVFSKKIECVSKKEVLIWDLSGSDGLNSASTPAKDGLRDDPDGQDGSDGEPGSEGGCIILIAELFLNLAYVIFRSKGGNGGRGQDGGNGYQGEDGRDGVEFSLEKLKEEFPSPAKQFKSDSVHNRKTKLTNLHKLGGPYESDKKSINVQTGESKGTAMLRSYKVSGVLNNGISFDVGYFQKGTFRQSYCLMRGQPGTPGTPGGAGGAGGLGGYGGKSGSFGAFLFDTSLYGMQTGFKIELGEGEHGDDGVDGENGSPGESGKDGKDVGYVDNQWWRGAVYYSGGKFELATTEKEVTSSVWCNHRESWVSIIEAQNPKYSIPSNHPGNNAFGNMQGRGLPRRKNVPPPSTTFAMQGNTDMTSYAFERYLDTVNQCDVDENVGLCHADWWIKNMFENEAQDDE